MATPVKIQPIQGELFRFHVESRTRPQFPHLVDLQSFKWNGQCDCERFTFGCQPLLVRGADAADHIRCSHIKAARSFFLDVILPKIGARMTHTIEKVNLAKDATGMISAIVATDESEYQLPEKLSDLMEIKNHLDASIEQIQEEIESARDPHKHEDHPVSHGNPDDMNY